MAHGSGEVGEVVVASVAVEVASEVLVAVEDSVVGALGEDSDEGNGVTSG